MFMDISKLRTVALKLFAEKLLTPQQVEQISVNGGYVVIPKNYLPHAKVTRNHAISMLGVGEHSEFTIEKEMAKIEMVRKIVSHKSMNQVNVLIRTEAVRKGYRMKNFKKPDKPTRLVEEFSDLKEM
jgi:hypothetical protein